MNKTLVNLKTHTAKAVASLPVIAAAMTTTALASTPPALPTVAITQDMLKPILDGVISNIGVILPIGLGLFSISIGIRIIPGLISRFLKM